MRNKRNRIVYLLSYIRKNKILMESLVYKFRFLNVLRSIYEYKSKKTKLSSMPYLLQIEPVMGCNLKCPLCPVGDGTINREKGMMSLSNFKVIIDKLSPYVITASLWLWGEPLLNPKISDMVSYAHKKKIHTTISTNAHFLNEKICEDLVDSKLLHLRISLYGGKIILF